ncbi:MAG: hypothetical protein ISR23_03635 [Candidatus Poseidoniaceae archaeon]|nr:hypothetical protein [Candidatus Poseidoniaceae archaeon]
MRRATIIVAFFMISTILFMPTGLSQPQIDGSTQVITSSESWDTNSELNGDVTVTEGATLTISGQISIATGSSILIDSGANLVLTGELSALEMSSGVFMEVYDTTVLQPNFTGLVDSGTLRINMAKDYFSTMDVNVTVGDNTVAWTGEEYIDYSIDFNDLAINVSFQGFWQFPVWIDSIQAFDSNGVIYNLDADEWQHNNGVLKTEEGEASYSIIVKGNFDSNSGSIEGADLSCSGVCTIDNSTLSWSSPVNVADSGTLSIMTSVINGSRTYEDIIVHDTAIINYDTTTMIGTGGPTDSWIRLLSQRVISTNLKDAPASVHFEGLGYLGSSGDLTLDENGNVELSQHNNPELNKYLRMTEWLDSSGDMNQEEAVILITLSGGNSAWSGNYSITLDPAPTTPLFTATIPLPYVVIDSVAPEDNKGTANKGIGVMVTASNTGDVEVSTNIQCFEGDELADVTTLYVTLAPGESKDIPTTWYANSSGAKSLNCKPLILPKFNTLAEDLGQIVGTESELVSFKDAEDSEDMPIILYGAIVIVIVIATIIFSRISAMKLTETEEEKDYSIDEDDDEDEDTGVIE